MSPAVPARARSVVIVLACVVPFGALVLQAAADRWTGRAVLPQELGLRGVRTVWADPVLVDAVLGSFAVALAVAVAAVLLAWPAARYVAAAGSVGAWAVLAAPVLVPPLVMGDGLAVWFLEAGLSEGRVALALAHLPVAVPYAVLALTPAFGDDLDELDHTAAVLGASPGRRLLHVVGPAARAHVALALALAFTVSWSQYATSLAVCGGTPMLPLVLVPFVRSDPQVGAVLALVFVVPPVLALGAAASTRHRPWSSRGGSIAVVDPPHPA